MQKIPLRVAGAEDSINWQIVNVNKSSNIVKPKPTTTRQKLAQNSMWLPMPGKYQLIISDKQGKFIDSADFRVLALHGKNK